jgi:hypothetical protein
VCGVASLAWEGPRARRLPYVAGKRVVPDSLHPGFGGDGRGCPWSPAGCDPDAEAGSPRPVSYGALGYAAAAAPFAGPSRPPLGDGGIPGGAGSEDGVELTQQAAGDRDPGLGGGELVVGAAGQVRVPGGEHGVVPQRGPHRSPRREAELGAASSTNPGLALVGA